MTETLTNTSVEILNQLKKLVQNITDKDYSKPIELLSGNTIAKHIRHVIELYEEMLKGIDNGTINYDARKRNLLIEHNREYTLQCIDELILKLKLIYNDKLILLEASFDNSKNEFVKLNSSINRELAYNIEHTIHHMAIMQIIVKHQINYINLEDNFGVAISTQKYNNENVHANLRT